MAPQPSPVTDTGPPARRLRSQRGHFLFEVGSLRKVYRRLFWRGVGGNKHSTQVERRNGGVGTRAESGQSNRGERIANRSREPLRAARGCEGCVFGSSQPFFFQDLGKRTFRSTRNVMPSDDSKNQGLNRTTPVRVLIIDDDADQRTTLGLLLRALGHEVHAAADGRSGLAAVAAFNPEVVLLDFHMPLTSGYETAAALRLQPASCSVRLVLMTGS
jgi:CheY-like chemotaxis protein